MGGRRDIIGIFGSRSRWLRSVGNTIVADEWVREDEDLRGVGGVGKRLRISHHAWRQCRSGTRSSPVWKTHSPATLLSAPNEWPASASPSASSSTMSAFPLESSHRVEELPPSIPRPVAGGYKLPGGLGTIVAEKDGGALENPGRGRAEGDVPGPEMGEEGGVASEMTTE